MLLSGTSTRSAPAGRRPPKPSRQVHTFMKKLPRASPAIMPVAGWQCAHMCALAWSRAPYTRHAADMTVRARFFMSGRA